MTACACVCLRVRVYVREAANVCACTHACGPACVCGLSYASVCVRACIYACMMQIVILSDKKFENS